MQGRMRVKTTLFSASTKPKIAREIFKYFVGPFVKYMKELSWCHLPAGQLCEIFFHIDDRVVKDAMALQDFKMPGRYVVQCNRGIPGYGDKKIYKGEHLVIRLDKTMDRVDIEVVRDKPKPNTKVVYEVFYLTVVEYKNILPKIKFIKVEYE